MGCDSVEIRADTMRGRGVVTTIAPSQGNSMIGTLHIEDTQGGPAVYDIRVTLSCVGRENSTPHHPTRLSCVHNAGAGASTCHMVRSSNSRGNPQAFTYKRCRESQGRIEVWQPNALHVNSGQRGTWGTVCGHWLWENDHLADITCRALGFSSGTLYTFVRGAALFPAAANI